MTFKIEDGVPVPPHRNAKDELADTLRAMKVGQSILIDLEDEARARANYLRISKKLARKYTCRVTEYGPRIWRIE